MAVVPRIAGGKHLNNAWPPCVALAGLVDPITISVVFAFGFAVGYGVREWKSRKRRRRYAET